MSGLYGLRSWRRWSWCLDRGIYLKSSGLQHVHAHRHHTGVIELLQSGFLPADHWDWFMGASFKWGMVSGGG